MIRSNRIQRSAVIITLLVFMAMQTQAGLVYDPDTNSYVQTTTETTDTSTNTTQETTQSDQQNQEGETTQEQVSSIGGTAETTDQSDDTVTEQSTDTTNNQTDARDGSLQYMHVQVDEYVEKLQALLTKNYNDLRDDASGLLSDGTTTRLHALQCLGIVDEDFDYLEDIVKTRIALENQINIVKADLHSTIIALEDKIDGDLLTSLDRNLQIGSVQNKIDGYYEEFTNMIEMYYELSLDEVKNADQLIAEQSSEYVQVLDVYDNRIALIDSVEKTYATFLQETTVGGSSGVDLQSLMDFLDTLEVYYRASFMDTWERQIGSHIPLTQTQFLELVRTQSVSAFSAYFATQTDGMLYGLYPIEALQSINTKMVTLRASYKYDNGSFDCKAILENNAVDTMAPALEKEMKDMLLSMNQAAQSYKQSGGTIPTSTDELQEFITKAMNDYDLSDIDALIAQEKVRIQNKAISEGKTRLPTATISQKIKRKRTVREFLQENYKIAMQQGRLASYNKKIHSAHAKVLKALGASPTGATKQMLEAIKEVIEEFM